LREATEAASLVSFRQFDDRLLTQLLSREKNAIHEGRCQEQRDCEANPQETGSDIVLYDVSPKLKGRSERRWDCNHKPKPHGENHRIVTKDEFIQNQECQIKKARQGCPENCRDAK
jgi:hypothetical protein